MAKHKSPPGAVLLKRLKGLENKPSKGLSLMLISLGALPTSDPDAEFWGELDDFLVEHMHFDSPSRYCAGSASGNNLRFPFRGYEPLGRECRGLACIKLFAGEDVHVRGVLQVEGMDDDRAREDELYGAGPFGLGVRLLFILAHANIVPEVQVAPLHVDQLAKLGAKLFDGGSCKATGVAAVQV